MKTVYYVVGIDANFFELKDALLAGAEYSIRHHETVSIVIDTGNQAPYVYCKISMGDQA